MKGAFLVVHKRPYYLAARYPSKTHSGNAKVLAWAIAYLDNTPLSVFSIQSNNGFYVVVVGNQPPEETAKKLENAFVSGTRVELSPADLDDLYQRFLAEHPQMTVERGNEYQDRVPRLHKPSDHRIH